MGRCEEQNENNNHYTQRNSNQQLIEKANQFIKIYNSSTDSWHKKCLDEALEVIEAVAKERGIEI